MNVLKVQQATYAYLRVQFVFPQSLRMSLKGMQTNIVIGVDKAVMRLF